MCFGRWPCQTSILSGLRFARQAALPSRRRRGPPPRPAGPSPRLGVSLPTRLRTARQTPPARKSGRGGPSPHKRRPPAAPCGSTGRSPARSCGWQPPQRTRPRPKRALPKQPQPGSALLASLCWWPEMLNTPHKEITRARSRAEGNCHQIPYYTSKILSAISDTGISKSLPGVCLRFLTCFCCFQQSSWGKLYDCSRKNY